jgi:phosphoribosyl 1,2-cyclic phosphodiesterase
MRIHFCGVRGSMPAAGAEFSDVGGHTSCVALARNGGPPTLVLDAGTGLCRLSALLEGAPFAGTVLLSHLHWDHTLGLPFFAAGDRPDARVRLLLPEQGYDAESLIERFMSPPHFPITPAQLRGAWTFGTLDEGHHEIEGFDVVAREIPHKGGRTFGYRISDRSGATVAYLSDHAPHELGPGRGGFGVFHDSARALAAGADLLIHDAQYRLDELDARASFGHAAADYALALGHEVGAKKILLFHHDPARTDAAAHELLADVRERHPDVVVDLATESTTVTL